MFAVLYCSTSYLSSSATPSIYHPDAKRPQDLEFQLDFLSFDAEAATTCPARMCISIYLDPFCLSKGRKVPCSDSDGTFRLPKTILLISGLEIPRTDSVIWAWFGKSRFTATSKKCSLLGTCIWAYW